jgi:hypothetical protein
VLAQVAQVAPVQAQPSGGASLAMVAVAGTVVPYIVGFAIMRVLTGVAGRRRPA